MTEAGYLAWAEGLVPEDRRIADEVRSRAVAERQQIGWRSTPYTMARHLETPETWAPYAFQEFLARQFVDAVTGAAPFQTWNLPAQVGKTENIRRCVAWALDRRPQDPLIYTSYGADLAVNSARFVRDYGVRYSGQLRYRLRADATKVGEWLTTEGGGLKATGIRGGLSGFPAAGLVLDDPHKNWQEAHSRANQEEVWSLFNAVLRLRLRMGGWIIVLHTRWAENDITGRIEESAASTGEEWRHVVLPMIAEDDDVLGRSPGEVLEPSRFDLASALARARSLGSYLSAALEQQRPAPPEGGILKRAWWLIEETMPERFDDIITSWDMKMKDVARRGDSVAGQVWGRVGNHYWMLDGMHGQWSQLQTKLAVALMQVRWPQVSRHYLENTGNGPEVMRDLRAGDPPKPALGYPGFTLDDATAGVLGILDDEREPVEALMRRGMTGLLPNTPKGDKWVRVVAVSGIIEGGNCHVRDTEEGRFLIEQASAFPQGSADDAVDAMSQGLAILSGSAGTTTVTSSATASLPTPTAGRGLGRPGSIAGSQLPRRVGPRIPGPR